MEACLCVVKTENLPFKLLGIAYPCEGGHVPSILEQNLRGRLEALSREFA